MFLCYYVFNLEYLVLVPVYMIYRKRAPSNFECSNAIRYIRPTRGVCFYASTIIY